MYLEELFYFVIGLMVIYAVYWQIFIANEDSHREREHNGVRYSRGFVPEPHNLLRYSKESALLADWEKAAFGDEEE